MPREGCNVDALCQRRAWPEMKEVSVPPPLGFGAGWGVGVSRRTPPQSLCPTLEGMTPRCWLVCRGGYAPTTRACSQVILGTCSAELEKLHYFTAARGPLGRKISLILFFCYTLKKYIYVPACFPLPCLCPARWVLGGSKPASTVAPRGCPWPHGCGFSHQPPLAQPSRVTPLRLAML